MITSLTLTPQFVSFVQRHYIKLNNDIQVRKVKAGLNILWERYREDLANENVQSNKMKSNWQRADHHSLTIRDTYRELIETSMLNELKKWNILPRVVLTTNVYRWLSYCSVFIILFSFLFKPSISRQNITFTSKDWYNKDSVYFSTLNMGKIYTTPCLINIHLAWFNDIMNPVKNDKYWL